MPESDPAQSKSASPKKSPHSRGEKASKSSFIERGELTRSTPTLGSITDKVTASVGSKKVKLFDRPAESSQHQEHKRPAEEHQQHQRESSSTSSAQPSFGPAPQPFSSQSSISTGVTPLKTTPGGSSTPVKLSMSSLTAAATNSGSMNAFFSGVPKSGTKNEPSDVVPPTPVRDKLVSENFSGATSKADASSAKSIHTAQAKQHHRRSEPASKLSAPRSSETLNTCSYFLLTAMFILVLLALVVTIVIIIRYKT